MIIKGKVILKQNRDQSIRRLHPWVFSGAIQKLEGDLQNGDWAEVLDSKHNTLGYGHYQVGSISVRMLSFDSAPPAKTFWDQKLQQAQIQRASCGLPRASTTAYRLIHGEGDGLPGLIVDMYQGVAVVQAHSAGMHTNRMNISESLQRVFKSDLDAVYYKSLSTLPGNLRDESQNGYLFGMSAVPHVVLEHDLKFYIDWEAGQKTGFFLDQRENRKLLAEFAPGKKVLNTFCYTGGFSVYALKAGAEFVHSIDASQKAIDLTKKNIELNGFDSGVNQCIAADTFEFIKDKHHQYDVIILDPPAFAKHRDARHQAIKGYQRLNAEAIKIVKPGGLIFTFSCSQVVDRDLFYNTVVSSAIQAGRNAKVLHQLTQPADHPVSMFHPEGEYLKGLVLYIE
jgi:23S rRNA (cytosine1962-C5)-methyltransferase